MFIFKAWLRSSQAMAIIGIILAFVTIVIAIVNVVSRSRGDRLRLIHLFISGGCFFAGKSFPIACYECTGVNIFIKLTYSFSSA